MFRVCLIAFALIAATASIVLAKPRVAQSEVEPRRTTQSAVVRKAASAKARVVAKLPANTSVTVVKETGAWIEITAKVGRRQIRGFVAKDAIAAPQTAAAPAPEPEVVEPTLTPPTSNEPRKTTEPVVVRKKPGEKEAAVGNLPAGTEVRVEGELGRWMKIRAGTIAGFVPRTQLTGPTPATDTTAFTPPPTTPPPAEPTRKWSKPDPEKPATDALSAFANADAPLRSDAKPDAAEVARVTKGARLAVVDATEVAGFIRVRDDGGHEGFIARDQIGNGMMASAYVTPPTAVRATPRSEVRIETKPVAVVEKVERKKLALRLDAGIGYRVLGMDFTSNGGSGLGNYLASASAGAADFDLDVTLRSAKRLVIGIDAQLGMSRSSPGIDYPGPTGPPGKVAFSTIGVDAGVRVGMRARRLFEIAARAGAHYDVFVTSSLENAGMLPRESLIGTTLGARVDVAPPGSRVSATIHADALVFGRRRQTSGLEDGTDSTARAVWAGVTARYAFGRRFAVLGAYDFGRATTEWSGMSTRDPGVTSARRVDSTQLVQVGLSIGL